MEGFWIAKELFRSMKREARRIQMLIICTYIERPYRGPQ